MIGDLYTGSLTGTTTEIEHLDGTTHPLDAHRWLHPIDGDHTILDRCTGPTLDIGSGPGRLTIALTRRAVPALGIDITPHAVRLTRRAGGLALCRDIFDRIPGSGRWATALLADGNIGIGGHPTALLHRTAQLLRPGGDLITELHPPGTPSRAGQVRLRTATTTGPWFPWASVSADDITRLAHPAGYTVTDVWHHARRWFAALRRTR
ncbi:methyltransferase type 12 [Sphaerisporangium rufum]|uniref:Methyltransferase type 12 n=1 Tax=Sphaerisporangium rufum TaxID=1381558 RepID=A0A919R291_9ACTN|nr:SAM-dependent methyltransferase [Sphaerisporangium rufum]GII78003.1 methyltransferase type 12 [Sphaerisporangium rufum]